MKYILSITLLSILLAACNSSTNTAETTPEKPPVIQNLSVADFEKKMAELDNEIILDVRRPNELEATGKIEGALNMNYQGKEFATQIATLNKEQPIMVYCAAGGRSKKAAAMLEKIGFTQVLELDSGMGGWQQAGKPVVKAR